MGERQILPIQTNKTRVFMPSDFEGLLREGSTFFVVVERVIFFNFLMVKNYAARMPEEDNGNASALGGTST